MHNDKHIGAPLLNIPRQNKVKDSVLKRSISRGKTTLVLMSIVAFFVITHSTRLALKVYMTIYPELSTKESWKRCL